MVDKSLDSRLRGGILIAFTVGFIIVAAGAAVMSMLTKSMRELSHNEMKKEVDECKQRIERQLDRDFQMLNTLASFFACQGMLESDNLAERLHEANNQNDFVTMGYFGEDGVGMLVNTLHGIKVDADYRDMAEQAVPVIEAAYHGTQGTSALFDSVVSQGRIYIYAVPVYNDGKIVGVLAASDYVEVFTELIKDHSVMGGEGAVYLLSQSGKILVSTTESDPSVLPDDFFHSPCFSGADQKRIQQAVSDEETVSADLTYDGKTYNMLMEPIGIHNWYIMCVSNQNASHHMAYKMSHAVATMCVLLLLLVLALLVYISRLSIRTNHHLTQLAYEDRLTGADNTLKFFMNLEEAREIRQGFTLAAINIHQFKFINELFGTKTADHLLCGIADTLKDEIHAGEFMCRDSADRFYVVIRETDEEEARERLENMMKEISSRAVILEMDYQIQMYAGAYIWTGRDQDLEMPTEILITRVLFAKKHSRGLPANHVHFYDVDVHKKEEMENYVETHMRQALVKGEFKLYLQPKINLKDGSLSGAEALVRWVTEDGKMIFPDSFIPQFESNGFCISLDLYMVEQVCKQMREWMDAGLEPIPVSVNQSKLLFYDADYIATLKEIVQRYHVPSSLITLEILEGLALDHAKETNAKIRRLKSAGFKVSMDDFGAGYSSLNTLGKLEINELKLDRSFLLEMAGDQSGRFCQIMEHVVHLAKSMNITTVVEGVETEENEALIRKMECDIGQGYFYSRPISAEEFSRKYISK